MAGQSAPFRWSRQQIGLVLGPLLAILLQILGPSDAVQLALGGVVEARQAWIVLSLLLLMAIWWISEAVPIPVTSLLPLIVLPMAGVDSLSHTASDYMHPVVVLLMGGFIFAKTIERWGLHQRIALNVVARSGNQPVALVGGFMAAAALLSMWISNTATSIMMMPIAMSVVAAVSGENDLESDFSHALLLGIAYGCSIGGLGTPVGTPTNLIVMGYLNEEAGYAIDFGRWMMLGLPAVLLVLPMAWFVLTRWSFPIHKLKISGGQDIIKEKLDELGKITVPEQRSMFVFFIVAGLWILKSPLQSIDLFGVKPFAQLSDAITAIIGVVLAHLIPAGGSAAKGEKLLDWQTAESIPWGVVLLFGGGMALAGAISSTGLGHWLGEELVVFAGLPVLLLILIIAGAVIFATEVTSNVATAAALTPVLGAMALSAGMDAALLAAPLALAASCAFMLPMATGPNAVAYATGHVSLPVMAGAGFRINFLAIPIITLIVYLLAPIAFAK